MAQSILPITFHIAEAVFEKKAPWRVSNSLARRMELKPFDKTSSFKKCLVLPFDPEMEFVKRYFNQGKPSNLKIHRIYCLDNPASTKVFERALSSMEVDSNKEVFQSSWSQGLDSDRRKEAIRRWKSMGDLFGPFEVDDSEISQIKILPLWQGTSLDRCLSIASHGFTFLGRYTSSEPSLEFGNGIYFTDNAKYASLHSPHHLLLSWVVMREPYPVINNEPHRGKGSDVEILDGKGVYQNYNAHYIPLASSDSTDRKRVDYHPCYDKQEAALDEFVVFEKAQAVARLWVDLVEEGSTPSYTIPEIMASVEEGDLNQVRTWIEEDRNRLQVRTEEGETLAYAALSGNQHLLLKWLHEEDRSLIHHTRHDGKTLPFLAVLGGRREILNFLLDEGISYSSSEFVKDARRFDYTKNQIAGALASVNWSIWKIPPKNPYFSGREGVMAEIRRRFSSDPYQSLTKLALVGLGGMGKSTLAAAYAHACRSRYSLIHWIEAEKSFRSGLKDLGIGLGLTKVDTPEEQALRRVISYLNKNPGWLLIFDHTESPSSLETFYPPLGKGHILITSRDTSWTNSLVVHSFSPIQSLSLMSKRTGYPPSEEGEKLAEELLHFPLALTQAGAYMAETGTSYKSYLDLYLQERKELLSSDSFLEDDLHGIGLTSKISLDRLKRTSPEILPILYRALYLAPDNIPKSILSEEGFSIIQLNNGLKALRSYNLLKIGQELDTFSIDRLVQTTIRGYLSEQEGEKTKKTLQEALEREWEFDPQVPNTWVKAKTLVPHLEAFSNLGLDNEMTGRFLNDLGVYSIQVETYAGRFFNDLGIYSTQVETCLESAVDFLSRSLEIRKKIHGEEHPDVATVLQNLGIVHQIRNDFSLAVDFFGQALAIRKKIYGETDSKVADSLYNLGIAYEEQANFTLAIDCLTQSLEIRKNIFGEKHRSVADNLYRLGLIHQIEGNSSLAIDFLTQALEVRKELFGQEHSDVAVSLHALAITQIQTDFSLTVNFLNQALEIRKKIFGEEHGDVVDSLFSLGVAYEFQGNPPLAIDFFNQALVVGQKIYGEEHPKVANILYRLGIIHQIRSDFPIAIDFLTRALTIRQKEFGEKHCDVVDSLYSVGLAHQIQGSFSLAIDFLTQAFQVGKKVYGEEHPKVAHILYGLGLACATEGDVSIGFLAQSLDIRKKAFGEEHRDVVDSLYSLGLAHQIQGSFSLAIDFLTQAFQVGKKVYGEEHPKVADTLYKLGKAHQAKGDISLAIEFYKQSLQINKKILGESDPKVKAILKILGSLE